MNCHRAAIGASNVWTHVFESNPRTTKRQTLVHGVQPGTRPRANTRLNDKNKRASPTRNSTTRFPHEMGRVKKSRKRRSIILTNDRPAVWQNIQEARLPAWSCVTIIQKMDPGSRTMRLWGFRGANPNRLNQSQETSLYGLPFKNRSKIALDKRICHCLVSRLCV